MHLGFSENLKYRYSGYVVKIGLPVHLQRFPSKWSSTNCFVMFGYFWVRLWIKQEHSVRWRYGQHKGQLTIFSNIKTSKIQNYDFLKDSLICDICSDIMHCRLNEKNIHLPIHIHHMTRTTVAALCSAKGCKFLLNWMHACSGAPKSFNSCYFPAVA